MATSKRKTPTKASKPRGKSGAASTPAPTADRAFQPRDFLRSRRPEQFSDSETTWAYHLTETQLEYHLDTLTSRRQEAAFENFARGLLEREVCPNILPQTGPVGGGDSHTDASTYPVAEELAGDWPWFMSQRAKDEFWGFAFSAKKKWRAKLDSDVAKLANLSPRPTRAFFVTNQFVRDKLRAEVISHVRTASAIDLTILDRSWLVQKTIAGNHVDLAADALGLDLPPKSLQRLGPMDAQRTAELRELDERLESENSTTRTPFGLVEDYLLAGRLARGLDLPASRTGGYYALAIARARAAAIDALIIQALYEACWTAYWWHQDFARADQLYDELEPLALASRAVEDIQLLCNLWTNLSTLEAASGPTGPSNSKSSARSARILEVLHRMVADPDNPNTAAQARLVRGTMQLTLAVRERSDLVAILCDLKAGLDDAERRSFVPLTGTMEVLAEVGQFLPHSSAYEELIDAICAIRSRLEGDWQKGTLLLKRGLQLLQQAAPREALGYLARARTLLTSADFRDALARAVAATGSAYQSIGLRSAARLEFLRASWLETRAADAPRAPTKFSAALAHTVWRLELELGFLVSALRWRAATHILARAAGEGPDYLDQNLDDGVVAVALLHTSREDVMHLGVLMPLLEDNGFVISPSAVKFLVRGPDEARADMPEDPVFQDVESFFQLAYGQPASKQMELPPRLFLQAQQQWTIDIAPAKVTFVIDSAPAAVLTAQHLAGLIEVAMHAVMSAGAMPTRSSVSVRIRCSTMADTPPRVLLNEDGGREHDVDLAVTPTCYDDASVDAQAREREWLSSLAMTVCAMCCHCTTEHLEQLGDGGVLAQVFGYPSTWRCMSALFDPRGVTCASSTAVPENLRYIRDAPWAPTPVADRPEWPAVEPRVAYESPTVGRVLDLIRPSLWDAAEWSGMAFIDPPPLLGLAFKDRTAARILFSNLKTATAGSPDRLRVAIICDDSATRYVVHIGPRIEAYGGERGATFSLVTRINGFVASPGRPHLERFRRVYGCYGVCSLVACAMAGDGSLFLDDGCVPGVKVEFRSRGDIRDRHDLDSIALPKFDELG